MAEMREAGKAFKSLANYGFDPEVRDSILKHRGIYKNLAEAFIETLHAWEDDPSEKAQEIIDGTAKYLAEELPDAGDAVIALVRQTEPEAATRLSSARRRFIRKATN